MEKECPCKREAENKTLEFSKIHLIEERVKKIRDSANGLLGYISSTKKRKENISYLKLKSERLDQESRIEKLDEDINKILKFLSLN